MTFQKHSIHKNPKNTPTSADSLSDKKQKTQLAAIGGGIIIVVILLLAIYGLVRSLDFSSVIFSLGKNLHVDENGHTNVLIIGVGGEGHDGADLTDSLIVASIDYDHKLVPMVSIPRDLFVKSKKLNTGERINQVYFMGKHRFSSKEGLEELKDLVSGLVGIPIDYYIKVDFNGFKKIVDSIGGVDVQVEKDIYDPFYPHGETIEYETFSLKAGLRHLDSETALKFARSRKTTSDFDRAHRQQQLLSAIKEKALSLQILTDPGKIKAIYESVASSIETDLSINEIIELARVSKDFGKESIVSRVITDNPETCGGFLYTPPRENFGGASVLLPAGNNYDFIHLFTGNFFKNVILAEDQSEIQVLNGTKVPNVAGEIGNLLNRLCYKVVWVDNASRRDLTTTTIYYLPGPKGEKPPVLDFITSILPYKTVSSLPPEYLNTAKKQNSKVIIELGADYLNKRIRDPFNSLPPPASPPPSSSTGTSSGSPTPTGSPAPSAAPSAPKTNL